MSTKKPKDGTVTHEDPRDLIAWDGNPKPHDDLDLVRDSVKRFGFRSAVVVRPADKRILVGHGRTLVAIEQGIEKVPVLWADLDDDDAAAFTLVDNRSGELSRYDDDLLADALRYLQDRDYDLGATGFDQAEIDAIMGTWTPPEPASGSHLNDHGTSTIMVKVETTKVAKLDAALRDWLATTEWSDAEVSIR